MVKDLLKGLVSLVRGPSEDWGFHERRGSLRLRCHYKCICGPGEDRVAATVTDLAAEGLGFTCARPLRIGQAVTVFCPFVDLEGACEPVVGTVCWSHPLPDKTFSAGLKYNSAEEVLRASWVTGVLRLLGFQSQPQRCKRRWVRAECELTGQIGNPGHAVKLRNLGMGGSLLQSDEALVAGPTILHISPLPKLEALDLPGTLLELRGEKESPTGANTGFYGLQFHDLNPQQTRNLGRYVKNLLRRSKEK